MLGFNGNMQGVETAVRCTDNKVRPPIPVSADNEMVGDIIRQHHRIVVTQDLNSGGIDMVV
jgi:hypothetical protein